MAVQRFLTQPTQWHNYKSSSTAYLSPSVIYCTEKNKCFIKNNNPPLAPIDNEWTYMYTITVVDSVLNTALHSLISWSNWNFTIWQFSISFNCSLHFFFFTEMIFVLHNTGKDVKACSKSVTSILHRAGQYRTNARVVLHFYFPALCRAESDFLWTGYSSYESSEQIEFSLV